MIPPPRARRSPFLVALAWLLVCSLALGLGTSGCKRLLKKKTVDACVLVTDSEMESATGAKVDAHKGAQDSCDWTFQGGKVQSVHVGLLSPLAAKIIPQLGKPEAVPGLGDRAEWSGGFAPQLRVYKGSRVLHIMMIEIAPTVTLQEGKSRVVEKKTLPGGGGSTLTTTEETFDFPEMKTKMLEIARIAVARM